jgi:molybdopterin molybdotransferase
MVKECGAIPVQLGIVKDIKEDLEENLQKSLQSDMIITTGGVSMGRYDYVKDVLNKMGIELKYSKVAMRPGPSQIFGILEGKPVFGLPGNHVSSMVSFELFVRPSILKMMGFPNIFKCIQKAHLKEDLTTKSGKKHFIRGVLEYDKDIRTVTPIRNQGSTVSSSKFNCLIMVPEDAIEIKAGKLVGVLTLDPYFDLQKKQKFNIE